MKTRILIIALVALMALASNALAYRLVVVPSGDVLPVGYTRLEVASARVTGQSGNLDGWYTNYRLDSTVLKNFEVGVNVSDAHGKPTSTVVNLQYQVVAAKGYQPGLSVGAWDAATATDGIKSGRSAFVAAYEVIPINGICAPVKLHLGYGDQRLNGFWGGAIIPLDPTTQLALEYTPTNARLPGGKWYTVAIGRNFTPNWRFKVADIGGYLGIGAVYINHVGK